MSTRRRFLLVSLGTLAAACAPPDKARDRATRSLAEIEAKVGGRVGVFGLDTGNGREMAHRPDERFVMCSTFKWVLAAAILERVDRDRLSLDDRIPYDASDLLDHAPVTREHLPEGSMTVRDLAECAVTVSDNTAANLLLTKVGGPAGLTEFARTLGDTVTRLDRTEPSLNTNDARDPRDTTSPRAMVGLMNRILCGNALAPGSRDRLTGWLRACKTGKERLRAGFPPDWIVGDKTGTGENGAVNDVAIAVPNGRAPLLVAVYLSDSTSSTADLAAAHADIARVMAHEL